MTLLADLRYALRQLRRSPMYTLATVLTLGLGLGATTTMWSVVRSALLAPVPYHQPQQLAGLAFTFPSDKPNDEQIGTSADFLARHTTSFSSTGIAEDGNEQQNLSLASGKGHPSQIYVRFISAGYLPTLAVKPLLGRNFTAEQDIPNGPRVALISNALWRNSFQADPAVIGKTIHLNEETFTITGVLPASFQDPSTSEVPQVWEPLALSPAQPGYDGDNYIMIGRLKPHVSLSAAQGELDSLNAPFYHQYPFYRTWTEAGTGLHAYRAWPLATVLTSNVRASLLLLLASVTLVLALACLNLAGLSGTRIAARAAELQVRAALGANRWSLLRLLVAEGLLLAAGGAAIATVFVAVARPALLAYSPISLPQLGAITGSQLVLFILAVATLCCLLISFIPAATTLSSPLVVPGRSAVSAGRANTRAGAALVVLQSCFAMVLLAAASLLLGVFLKLQSTSPGFSPQHLVAAQVVLHGSQYDTTLKKAQFIQSVASRLQSAPGVISVGAIDGLPLDKGLNIGMRPDDRRDQSSSVEFRPITPGYQRTMQLHLHSGRNITDSDSAGTLPVALISETAARKWWPGQNALGHQVRFNGPDASPPMQIVGVVSDTHSNSLAEPDRILVYAPYRQLPDSLTRVLNTWITTSIILRVSAHTPATRLVEQAVAAADPEMPVANVLPLQAMIDKTNAAPRFLSLLASSFAAFAVLLSALGLFGLLSYQTSQRTREFGLRFALGATRAGVLGSIVRRGLLLTIAGTAAGLAISALLPNIVAALLPDIIYTGAATPLSLLEGIRTAPLLAAALLLAVAALASLAPALCAANTNPTEALRAE